MTIQAIPDGDNLIIRIEYSAETARIKKAADSAAENLFALRNQGNHGTEESPIVFADLTNQEKLNLVNAYVKRVILDLADEWLTKEGGRLGAESGHAEFETDAKMNDV